MLCLLLFIAAYAGVLYALHQRLLPVVVMRAWFTAFLLAAVVASWAGGSVLLLLSRKLKVMSRATAESLSRCVCVLAFGYILRLNSPHIRVEAMEGSLPWAAITTQHDLCLCHTSFFDTILYLWLAPFRYVYTAKTFAKAQLRSLPLFGTVVRACGQFPVYFTSDKSESFTVDKEKQAAVAAQVEAFLTAGGSLSFFPEGALNRQPEVLKDFRLGSFNTILQHRLPVYYCVTYGNHEVWHPDLKGIPGYPADVYVYIGKFEYDAGATDAKTLAKDLREEMQRHLTKMIELRNARGYKPAFVAPPPREKKTE